jgi:PAS domain S-box-containing protein
VYQPLADENGKVVGILAMGQDVTERHRAQTKLQAFSDSVPALTWVSSSRGRIEHCNERWYQYTGQRPGEALGEGWIDAVHPDDRATALRAWSESVGSQRAHEIEYRLRGRDGAYRWFLTRAVAHHDEAGNVLNWFGTSTDIDSVKRLEAALEEADRQKDQFVATLAHELRGPLAPILNAVDALGFADVVPASATRLRDIIKRQAKNISRLLDDLLDVSRVSRGRVDLRLEWITLQSLLDVAVEIAMPIIASKRHALEIDVLNPGLEIWVDPMRMAQVLANLLTNAAKYTDAGGSIVLTAMHSPGSLMLSVKDNGIGLPADVLEHVFTMFSQERALLDRSEGGLGIGLALVRALVELHGGTVKAASAGPGKGCEFQVIMPLDEQLPVGSKLPIA